jgi:hypothetical protein
MVEEVLCKNQLENGIAEELEALVVEVVPLSFVSETGVRESLR